MAKPKFVSGSSELQFSRGLRYPVARPREKVQATDRTAAGLLEVEDLGTVNIRTRPMVFRNLPQADYDALVEWYDNVADGAANTFIYYDENGYQMTVRMITSVLDFRQTSYGGYSGEIMLEVVG